MFVAYPFWNAWIDAVGYEIDVPLSVIPESSFPVSGEGEGFDTPDPHHGQGVVVGEFAVWVQHDEHWHVGESELLLDVPYGYWLDSRRVVCREPGHVVSEIDEHRVLHFAQWDVRVSNWEPENLIVVPHCVLVVDEVENV